MHAQGLVQKVAGLLIPLLAFASVGRELDPVAIRAFKGLVNVEDRLNVVVAWGKLVETRERIAECGRIDDHGGTGLPAVNVEAEELGARSFLLAKLETRLARPVGRDAKENVAVDGLAALGFRKGNLEAQLAGRFGGRCPGDGEAAKKKTAREGNRAAAEGV
jgi:hypothetical protein